MITQRYTIQADEPSQVSVGDMVFENNESELVTGFVNAVDEDQGTIEIILFDPIDATPFESLIIESVEVEPEFEHIFINLLRNNEKIRKHWEENAGITIPSIH